MVTSHGFWRGLKAGLKIVLAIWMTVATVIAVVGFPYVYAFEVLPRWHTPRAYTDDEPSLGAGSSGSLMPPATVDKVLPPFDARDSLVSSAYLMREYWSVERAEAVLFSQDEKPTLELYITSWDRDGKCQVKLLEIRGVRHVHLPNR